MTCYIDSLCPGKKFIVGFLAILGALILTGCGTEQKTQRATEQPDTQADVAAPKITENVIQWVDPFIGTAGDHGQLHPAATLPFGMVQMGPETPGRPHAGYDFNATTLEGFAHTRTAGVGCRGAGGNILMRADYGTPALDETGALVPVLINKQKEQAAVGQYQVAYGEPEVAAHMTVSPASGWQRYTFAEAGDVTVTLDTAHAHHETYGGQYQVTEEGKIQGEVEGPTVCKEGKYRFYFSMKPGKAPAGISRLDEARVQLHYQVNAGETLEFHTGISAVSADIAEQSRLVDAAVGGFEQALESAEQRWQETLNRIHIAADDEGKRLFYTHLYHIYQSPSNLTASTDQYRGSDNKVYSNAQGDYYFGWSIWDNFRTQLPLLTLLEPDLMADITRSLATLYQQNKQNWATQTEPLPTVRTEHSGIVLLDAWNKGIRSFDPDTLLPKMAEEADNMPRKSPDQVLEAAYDDWAVASLAEQTARPDMASQYFERASHYRETWLAKFKQVTDQFDIMHGDGLYEGTLWQYRWFVPYDMEWVIKELGGAEGFNTQLQQFFDEELYNMGNQPDIQAPFIFTFSGQPWQTQKLVHQLLHTDYNHWYGTHDKKAQPVVRKTFLATPEGLIPEMDNDAGTMSGWYLFASMGFYPVVPGEPVYSLHTPQFKSVTLNLENGKGFSITTDKDPVVFPYIQAATLNGKNLNRAWIGHEEITAGGTLSFVLSDTPNEKWGTDAPFITRLRTE